MESDTDIDDAITRAVLSGSTYERLRIQRPTFFTQSIPTKLAWQSFLLGVLSLSLPLYLLFPDTVATYLPATDPSLASPKILVLGLVGAGVELFTAGLLVAIALYRIRRHPLSEREATTVVDVEEFASFLGFGTGGLAIVITLGYFVLGLAGGGALEGYMETMDGINPFVASGMSLSVTGLATIAFVGCAVLLASRVYLARRLGELADD